MAILNDLMVKSAARIIGDTYASRFIKDGGTSTQFLMADGTVSTLGGVDPFPDLDNYLPLRAGVDKPLTGDLYLSAASDCPSIIFQRTGSGNYDWRLKNSGTFYLQNGTDSATWTNRLYIDTSGNITVSGTSTSTGFIKTGSSDQYVLLGGGGAKAINSFPNLNTTFLYNWSSGTLDKCWGRIAEFEASSNSSIQTTAIFSLANYYKYGSTDNDAAFGIIQAHIRYTTSNGVESNRTYIKWLYNNGIINPNSPNPSDLVVMTTELVDSKLRVRIYLRLRGNGSNWTGYQIKKLKEFYYKDNTTNWKVLYDTNSTSINCYANGITDADFNYNQLTGHLKQNNSDIYLNYGNEIKYLPIQNNIYANKFIKDGTSTDILLANGNTITQASLVQNIQSASGTGKTIWGYEYVNNSGTLQDVEDILRIPSGKYLTATGVPTLQGEELVKYYSDGAYGGKSIFGVCATDNTITSTYLRSSGDTLYHRRGTWDDYTDYLILDALNYTIYNSYPNLLITSTTSSSQLQFSRSGYNYIRIPSDGTLGISTSNSSASMYLWINPASSNITPGTKNNSVDLGSSNYKWRTVYATTFSGDATSANKVITQKLEPVYATENHYLTFVDSNNDNATSELVYTNSGLMYDPYTRNLTFPNDAGIRIKSYSGNYMQVLSAASANYQRINIGDSGYELNLLGPSNQVYINSNIIIHNGNYTTYLPFLNSTTTHATKTSKIYAPTSAGTANYILKSNGSGAPTWTEQSNLGVGGADKLKEIHKGSDGIDEGYPITFINNSSYTSIGENTYYDNYYNLSLTYNPVQSILNLEGGIIQGTQIQGNKVISKGVTVDELVNEFYNTEPEDYSTSFSLGFNNNFNYFAVTSNQSLTTSYVTYNLISKSWTTQTDQTGWWHFYRDGNDVKLKIEFSNSNEIPVATSVEINWIQIYIYDGSQTYYLVNDSSIRSIDLSNVTSNYCILNVNNFDIKKHYTQNTTIQFVVRIRCKKTVLNEQLPDQLSFDGDNIVTLTKFGLTENNLYNVGFYIAKANWDSNFPELNKSYLCKDGLIMAKTTVSYGAIKLDTNNNLEYIKCNKSNAVVHGTFNIVAQ